jgi:hypothetical protein
MAMFGQQVRHTPQTPESQANIKAGIFHDGGGCQLRTPKFKQLVAFLWRIQKFMFFAISSRVLSVSERRWQSWCFAARMVIR